MALFWLAGIAVWFAMQASGVHATIAGVLLGLLTPATPALTSEIVAVADRRAARTSSTPERPRDDDAGIARQSVSQLEWLRAPAARLVEPR